MYDKDVGPTLKIAREHGMVKTFYFNKRKMYKTDSESTPCNMKNIKDKIKLTTDLHYIIVIDFESTCWNTFNGPKNKKNRPPQPEIIEFPAVLMNLLTGEIEDQFQQYVMPIEQPKLSDFCTKLTGITQAQVEAGVPLKTCLWNFSKWLDHISMEKDLVPHGKTGGKQYGIVTWTDWDIKVCLANECGRKGIPMPKALRQWVDLKVTFKDWYCCVPKGLRWSMEEIGLEFQGREHSGLVDAQNTARLALALVREGAELYPSLAAM